jgi:hypothetical protein
MGIKAIGFMPGIAHAMEETAEEIADEARELAPVDEGDYIAGIEATGGTDSESAMGRVNANDWKSGLVEFGTGSPGPTARYAPLRRAVQQLGLRIKSSFGGL